MPEGGVPMSIKALIRSVCFGLVMVQSVPFSWGHARMPVKAQAINTFVAPDITANFVEQAKMKVRASVTSAHTHHAPALRYTVAGQVVQVWKALTRQNSEDHSLPDGTPLLHDPVTGASLGQFGAAYEIAGPMGSGSAGTPGGH